MTISLGASGYEVVIRDEQQNRLRHLEGDHGEFDGIVNFAAKEIIKHNGAPKVTH